MRRLWLGLVVVSLWSCGGALSTHSNGPPTTMDSSSSAGKESGGGGDSSSSGTSSGGTSGAAGPSDSSGGAGAVPGTSGSTGSGSSTTTTTTVSPGTLTAGTWDDNLNFGFFLDYLDATKPQGFLDVPRGDRLVVHVRDGAGHPLAGATVQVWQGGSVLFSADSPGEGDVLFFPQWYGVSANATLTVHASSGSASASSVLAVGGGEVTLTLGTTNPGVASVDVALVLDTTGSMGDEIKWLQQELQSISSDVSTRFAGVPQRWALVLYKDENSGDPYITRVTDFTTLAAFQSKLMAASSSGGGDYPEAVDQAVAATAGLSWSSGAVARLAFHVADAPQHAAKNPQLLDALKGVRAKGVHYYPVAASGVDEQFEQSFRTLAEMSGGRYLFLTNDSGVGGDHKEPTIPCYFVTKLHEAMVRMISMEISGQHVEPAAGEIIRTAGSPVSSQCTLANGTVVTAF